MTTIEHVRGRAAEVLRAAAHGRRDAERALVQSEGDGARVALAAVEGLETLSETVAGVREDLPAGLRDVLDLAARASWERLEAAGIRLDGQAGEEVDLARHRVVKTVAAAGRPAGTVASVVTPGVTFQGRRVRDAVVCAVEGKGHGAHRD
jgi:molecular chaperone GrpE (heat shock protein)